MKEVVITRENYRQIMLKRTIISCWVILIVCFIIKLFGGNFFAIICNDEKFIKVCNFIDSTIIYYFIAFIFNYISTFIFYYTVGYCDKINYKIFLIITIPIIITFFVKIWFPQIGQLLDFAFYFIIEIVLCRISRYSKKETIIRIILGFVLNNLFQIISLFVKNLGLFKILDNNSLIQIIFSIDYYIMLILYLLYSKKIKLEKEI